MLLPYTIDFTSNPGSPYLPTGQAGDATKQSFQIQPGTIDTTTTSLNLPGKGRVDYGELYNENLVRLMEHFSGPVAPRNPTRGQVWYDTSGTTAALKVFDPSNTGSGWVQLVTTGNADRFHVPVVDLLPTQNLVAGDIVFNSTTEKLYVCVELTGGTFQWLTVATQEWSETQLIVDGGTVAFA